MWVKSFKNFDISWSLELPDCPKGYKWLVFLSSAYTDYQSALSVSVGIFWVTVFGNIKPPVAASWLVEPTDHSWQILGNRTIGLTELINIPPTKRMQLVRRIIRILIAYWSTLHVDHIVGHIATLIACVSNGHSWSEFTAPVTTLVY